MKKIWFVLLAIGALFSSCSTELDINADWEERTIVYSIINRNNTEHFIRIHKAYLDPSRAALSIAPIKDSLYFSNADVRIEEYKNNTLTSTFVCDRIDTNAMQPGTFANPNQVLYRFYTPNRLDSSAEYRLRIVTPNGNIVRSKMSPIGGYPFRSQENAIFPPNIALITVDSTRPLNWSSPAPFRVIFRAPRNAKSYNLTLRIVYNEWPTQGPISDSIVKFVDWNRVDRNLITGVNTSESKEIRLFGRELFAYMNASIPVNPSVSRRMRGVSFFLTFADEELTNFLTLNTSSQSATDIRPEYTNIENGLGIFGTTGSVPEKSPQFSTSAYEGFSYRWVLGGTGTDSLRINYPQLNFVP